MQGQVDEDVDPVAADPVGHLGIAQAHDALPLVGQGLKLLGDAIARADVGVGDERGLPAVVMAEQGEDQLAGGVIAEIGRDESDPQPPIGRAVVRVRANLRREGLGEAGGPEAMLGQDRLGIIIGMKMEGEQEIVMGHHFVALQRHGAAVGGDGLVEPSGFAQGVAQVVVGGRIIGLERDGAAARRAGLVEPARPVQGDAEVSVGLGILGLELDGAAEAAMASSSRPCSSRAMPRLLWTTASTPLSSRERR